LIDRIDIIEEGKSLIALKNMTINEPFFQGHFPGQPVMPGVLSLEIMAQAGSFLMLNQIEDPLSMNMFFSTVEAAKFRKPITPGDQLKVHMELVKRKLNLCKFHGKCFVDQVLVAEAKFAANLVDRAKE
jgi:beta-hydroxyacyl-ACP dehydratase FabZ